MKNDIKINTIQCPGCAVVLPDKPDLPDSRLNASRECWYLFCRLSEKTIYSYDRDFIHQLAIDTYEAQHGGGKTKNISTAFGLIGLYLALEKKYNGREVQKAHIVLANRTKDWPRFDPPTHNFEITIKDVLEPKNEKKLNGLIRLWADSTWKSWTTERDNIIRLVDKFLYPD